MANVYSTARKQDTSEALPIRSRDKLELSEFAVVYSGAVKTVKAELAATSDDKISRISRAIKEGTYQVDARDVAERIFAGSRLG